jgi:hypothetical protein
MKFEPCKTYWTRSMGDSNCIHRLTVLSRTTKTIRAIVGNGVKKTLRVTVYDGVEQVKPYGSYSMCAVISADKQGDGPAPSPAAESVLTRREFHNLCVDVGVEQASADGQYVRLKNGSQWLWDSRFDHWAPCRPRPELRVINGGAL